MNIFIEGFDGDFAICRLPDKDKNLIRIPLRELPKESKPYDVLTLRKNGTLYNNKYAKEQRFEKICEFLNYKTYNFDFLK